ncbi:MAG: YeeE/YedE family protein [Pseudomonadota bacterium]|nr:YeeE/YedE family protein [Pseudomonadota bacterium]
MFDTPWTLAACGLLVGVILGYVSRRNHFCTMSALERYWYAGDGNGLRAWVLAAAVALVATQAMIAAGMIDLSASFYLTPVLPVAGSLAGGLMFGIGMALVGTCGFGAIIRLGGGNLRALVVLTGIGLAAIAAQRGITGHFRIFAIEPLSLDLAPAPSQSIGDILSHATGLALGLPLALVIGGTALAWVFSAAAFRRDRGKIAAGAVIGLCISAGWLATSFFSGRLFSEVQLEAGSFVTPVGDTILQLITVTGTLPDYGVGLVVGVFVGAAAAAWWADDLRWEACDDARELGRHLAGAFLMGTGGVFAMGCTIGQGVSAVSVMALSAPITLLGVVFGARIGIGYLLEGAPFAFLRQMGRPYGRREPAE